MNFQVRTKHYEGPLGKLLELIEAKKLEITEISLAEVTGDFLKYVKELGENRNPGEVADFLVVAAKLVLIKSKVLLPMLELTKEEEEDIRDLEGRLKIYREFKTAAEHLQKIWHQKRISYSREFLASLGEGTVFYPPSSLAAGDLVRAVNSLAAALQVLVPEVQTIKQKVVTIEQKIEELLNRFKEAGSGKQSFRTLSQQKSRQEVIALFLAILHLLKDKIVQVGQSEHFSDITVERI